LFAKGRQSVSKAVADSLTTTAVSSHLGRSLRTQSRATSNVEQLGHARAMHRRL
jgi:hypothetical protein